MTIGRTAAQQRLHDRLTQLSTAQLLDITSRLGASRAQRILHQGIAEHIQRRHSLDDADGQRLRGRLQGQVRAALRIAHSHREVRP